MRSNDLKDTCPVETDVLATNLLKPIFPNVSKFNLRAWETRSWVAAPRFVSGKALLDHPSFQANVIESERPLAGHKIVACGMGVFVTRAFADREIRNPRPGLNSRIIAGVASGESVVLSRAQIAAGNAGEGLDFVNMYGTWRDGIMNADQLAEVQALLGTSFVEHFAGYRFNRVLKEAIGHSSIALARATGTYRLVAEFQESESALAVATPRERSQPRRTPLPQHSIVTRRRYSVCVLRSRNCLLRLSSEKPTPNSARISG